ncbi:hypothetical protein [Bradyrhizobium sp. SZCCHNRI1073]|uniref:hypothetical protein n=1 Tax=Bradyrhizobium sp. SZCCHNRI1073 TaxID=3057280 RepID=UPI002915DE0D|nr:hypothetical protein [Bradyrhizobium sp. SZCCHNRI1073]
MVDADEWERITPAAGEDEWEPLPASEQPFPGTAIPDAFIGRMQAGAAVSRIMSAAAKGAKEGAGEGTPTGFEDETLAHLIELGIFHDPAKGRPGPLQTANEAVMMPAAQIWQAVTRATSGAIHGGGEAMGQLVEELGGSQGTANRAKNEVINFANWAMIEGGMGHVSRPSVEGGAVLDRTVGTLPTETDFAAASDVMTRPKSGVSLRPAPEGGVYTPDQIKAGEKYFKVYGADGEVKAEALVKIDGNTAKVEDILAPGKPREEGRGTLGPREMRDVLRQFREQHPEIEKITGERVSGAAAEGGYDLLGERRQVEMNLRRMWEEDGIHPAEAVHDAQADAFFRNEVTAPREEIRPAIGFKTAKGSTYEVHEDGTTTRNKAARPDAGHEGDSGLKPRSAKTIYLDTPEMAANLSAAGLNGLGSKGARVIIRDGKASLLTWNDAAGKWGISPGQKDIPFSTEPAIGRAPLEVWKPADDVPGWEAYRGMHAGNPITELTTKWDVKPEEMQEAFGDGASLSAAVTPPDLVPPDVQPPRPAGSLAASAQKAAETLFDIGRDIQMKLAPMAAGTRDSMATVKDYMNSMRRNAWDASRIDTDLVKRFPDADRARMANAMEEESLSLRLEEPAHMRENQGLATLEPAERAMVEELNRRQQNAWLRARDLGMVEGDGIEMHYPRMVVGLPKGLDAATEGNLSLTAIGYDLRSRTPFMKQRKHLELEDTEKAIKAKVASALEKQGKTPEEIAAAVDKVKVVRDIRAVNLATSQLEDAVAGRTLIEQIKDVGKRTGDETVAEGWKPGDGWFTVDHPSFRTWRPKLGDDGVIKDPAGNPVFESVPIYVRGDFEGPLRAAMWGKSGATYQGLMAVKGKTMGLIMNSPMIHNMVEWGRAVVSAPIEVGTLRVYFAGNRAKQDIGLMHEAINSGLVPIGKRFFNQDINAVMEAPDLTPGRSWTAKVLAAVPGLFDEGAGIAVKKAIDKAGDFWHNTLLWDRIGDLQAGLYVHFRDDLLAKGMDRSTAARMAAHWANRYAGALPREAMSEGATKLANFMMFSRSFTLGNLGVMKDALTGLPRDVIAQIERDAGFRAGSIEAGAEVAEQAVTTAKSMARRKAMMILGIDIAAMYIGNSLLQSAFNIMLGDSTIDRESHEYLRRFRDVMNEVKVHPLSLLQPLHIAERLSATGDNEPGKRDRILVGYAKDGTGIYARNPVGKIGEEFTGYFSGPLDMLRKKEGTIARPLMQIFSNDAGFGRKIYDPNADDWGKYASNMVEVVKHLIGSQLPMGQLRAAHDLVTGEGDKTVNALQLAGPLMGVTFSRGAPGGPAVGEMYDAKSRREFAISKAMPDLRRQIQRGDVPGAQQVMQQLGMDASYQRWVIKTSLDPRLRLSARSIRDLYNSGTEDQKARFGRALERMQPAP